MTTIYFIRHAEPNYNNHDDLTRELSAKGLEDRKTVTKFLKDKNIQVALSSPFKRAIDTIKDFADGENLTIVTIDDFRERRVDSGWIEDFNAFAKAQWADFDYKLSDGECLREVQERNISALHEVLRSYKDRNIIVGSHGTALSTIINYFYPDFGYKQFEEIRGLMPWIVKFEFEGEECKRIHQYNVFTQEYKEYA